MSCNVGHCLQQYRQVTNIDTNVIDIHTSHGRKEKRENGRPPTKNRYHGFIALLQNRTLKLTKKSITAEHSSNAEEQTKHQKQTVSHNLFKNSYLILRQAYTASG